MRLGARKRKGSGRDYSTTRFLCESRSGQGILEAISCEEDEEQSMGDVAVIGGGASGLAAAIEAARAGYSATVYEATDRVGKKILATGNGRCNLTNMLLKASDYNHPDFVAPALNQLGPEEIRAWFSELGLFTVEEREGRVYPLSNTANSVLDVLRETCTRLGIEVVVGAKAEAVRAGGDGFALELANGDKVAADKVIIAAGGGSRLLKGCGHKIVRNSNILCAISTDTRNIRGMSGVRVRGHIKLMAPGVAEPAFEEDGELLFRDYGVSGIAAFNASRFVEEGQTLFIDFIPTMSEEELASNLEERLAWAATAEELMCGIFHPQVNRLLMRVAGVKPSEEPELGDVRRLARTAKSFRLAVKGPGDVKHAQVTRGGADVNEFDAQTMQSKKTFGLYACGECLDVDGPCGGFNLHWAWASGITAGRSIS